MQQVLKIALETSFPFAMTLKLVFRGYAILVHLTSMNNMQFHDITLLKQS